MPRRKKTVEIPPHVLIVWEEIIRLLIKGETEAQIAHKTSLVAPSAVRTMIAKTEFQAYFKELDKEGFKTWQSRLLGETKIEAVQSEAADDAGKYYTIARDLLIDPDNDLRAKERLDGAIKALQLSGVTGEDAVEETIVLSPVHVKTLIEALHETACTCTDRSHNTRIN